jgi:hypothetical protein
MLQHERERLQVSDQGGGRPRIDDVVRRDVDVREALVGRRLQELYFRSPIWQDACPLHRPIRGTVLFTSTSGFQ